MRQVSVISKGEGKMEKIVWVAKCYTGCKTGWQEIKRFENFEEGDNWICSYVREKRCLITDFTLEKRIVVDARKKRRH